MTEFGLFTVALYLHVGAAIIAFGPTFAFPIIGAMASKDPMHANFAMRITEAMVEKLVLPFAISMPFTGVLLIFFGHYNLVERSGWWLTLGIVLYAIAISIAVALQRPLIRRMVHLTSGGPPPGAPSAAAPGAPSAAPGGTTAPGAPTGAATRPSGPPPEVRAIVAQIQRNGKITGILIVVIVLLMVVKPHLP